MAKLKQFDMNMDITIIPVNQMDRFLMKEPTNEQKKNFQIEMKKWAALPEKERGEEPIIAKEYNSGAEFVLVALEQALNQTHPTGNIQVLRRTRELIAEMQGAIESKEKPGIVLLQPDDFNYIHKSFAKADKWVNNNDNAVVLCAVDDLLNKAEDINL